LVTALVHCLRRILAGRQERSGELKKRKERRDRETFHPECGGRKQKGRACGISWVCQEQRNWEFRHCHLCFENVASRGKENGCKFKFFHLAQGGKKERRDALLEWEKEKKRRHHFLSPRWEMSTKKISGVCFTHSPSQARQGRGGVAENLLQEVGRRRGKAKLRNRAPLSSKKKGQPASTFVAKRKDGPVRAPQRERGPSLQALSTDERYSPWGKRGKGLYTGEMPWGDKANHLHLG